MKIHPPSCLVRSLPGLTGFSVAVVCALSGPSASAQTTPVLVKDLNTNPVHDSPYLVRFGDHHYFEGQSAAHGGELWRCDADYQNPVMMMDISPGDPWSSPDSFTVSGNHMFFSASSPNFYRELWVTDGTVDGTRMVKDIAPYQSSTPTGLTAFKNGVLFQADDKVSGKELWFSDGTAEGTVMLADTRPGFESLGYENEYLRSGSDRMFFVSSGDNGGSRDLWITDGSPAGTKQLGKTKFRGVDRATIVGNLIYFAAFGNGSDDYQLWRSDGTEAGTKSLGGKNFHSPTGWVSMGKELFFTAIDKKTGRWNLHKTNGTPAGTRKLLPKSFSSPYELTLGQMGSWVYFSRRGTNGSKLWKTNATGSKTVFLGNVGSFRPRTVFQAPGESKPSLYFMGYDKEHGTEPWRTDGTPQGTRLFADLIPGPRRSDPYNMSSIPGKLLIVGGDNDDLGNILWSWDGSRAGPRRIHTYDESCLLWRREGNAMLMVAHDEKGRELWKTDGTVAGTVRLTDIGPTDDSSPDLVASHDNKVYFRANATGGDYDRWHVTDGTAAGTAILPFLEDYPFFGDTIYFNGVEDRSAWTWDEELWKCDASGANPQRVKNINPSGSSNPGGFQQVGARVCFFADDGKTGREFWSTDGTAAGTLPLKDLEPGAASPEIHDVTVADARMYFFFRKSGTSDRQLWTSDGTPQGTVMLAGFTSVQSPKAAGSSLFFFAPPSGSGSQSPSSLWKSDGTVEGTVEVAPLPYGATLLEFTTMGNEAYYLTSASPDTFRDLWRSDGTAAGTTRILHHDTAVPYPSFQEKAYTPPMAAMGNQLLFWLQQGNRIDLWSSDGSAGGTGMLKSVTSHDSPVYVQVLTEDAAWFLVTDNEGTRHLWKSDGTPEGTGRLDIEMPLPWVAQPRIIATSDRLYFAMDSDAYGKELFHLPIADLRIVDGSLPTTPSPEEASPVGSLPESGRDALLARAFFLQPGGQGVLEAGTGISGLPRFDTVSDEASGRRVLRVEYLRRKNSGLSYQPLYSTSLERDSFLPFDGVPKVTPVDEERDRVVVEQEIPAGTDACFGTVRVTGD